MIRYKFWLVLSLSLVAAALGFSPLAQTTGQRSPKIALAASPEPIYSQDPNDAWNRIFYFLFSRRIETRLSDEFPEGAPFSEKQIFQIGALQKVHASTRVFERTEIGDRAIDPLYPSFFSSKGSQLVLADPAYSQFTKALEDALEQNAPRTVIARALMENDLWAAHDVFYRYTEEKEVEQRRVRVIDLLARLIKKIGLTPGEIKSLPDNYAAAVQRHSLPDVFRKDSGWIEVRFRPRLMHDEAAGYRRVSRVFLKPTLRPHDMRKFLNAQINSTHTTADLDGVALLTQLLLIDAQGQLKPTTLTTEVQVRLFEKTSAGVFKKTALQVAEISRRLFVREPASGGLVLEDETSPIYLASSGNDYTFAPTQIERTEPYASPPVQVKLRTRCAFCHGDNDLTFLMTFGFNDVPRHKPPVRQLDAAGREAADFVITQKSKQNDFEALLRYFGGAPAEGARH
jgi:hypothetical protein